jgi:O-antigen/teichoic acid export membrane protein
MTRLQHNLIANFAGQGWTALMALAFVPLYIRFLGIEAYGLIGFYAMLQAAFQILDLGLSQTMNREMARYSALPEKAGEARDFVRTLEVGYWSIGIILGITVLIASPFIAGHWIKPGSIPVKTIQHAVMIMGVVTALQWPLSFYEGGLMGLQHQVLLNGIKISITTLGICGSVLILWKVSPTINAYFTWQIIVNAIWVTLLMVFLWRGLPPADRPPLFRPALLRTISRFAAGMSGITISVIILTQMDKMILSKLLSLEMFGYYTLAGVASSVVPFLLVSPMFGALFPRFTSLVTINDTSALKILYHQSSQLMAVLALPISTVLAFFSFDILLLWTGNPKIAGMASPIVTVLAIGMALNAPMNLPYALQISHGWTSIGLRINIFLIISILPFIYLMATRYGAVGAACGWVALNGIYMTIGVPLTHRRLLQGEMRRWFIEDIGPSVLTSVLTVGLGRWLIKSPLTAMMTIVNLSCLLLITIVLAALVSAHMRTWLFIQLKKCMRANKKTADRVRT